MDVDGVIQEVRLTKPRALHSVQLLLLGNIHSINKYHLASK